MPRETNPIVVAFIKVRAEEITLSEFCEKAYPFVHSLANRFAEGDQELCDDITQDSLLKLVQVDLNSINSITAFLAVICRHTAYDLSRKKHRHKIVLDAEPENWHESECESIGTNLELTDFIEAIRKRLSSEENELLTAVLSSLSVDQLADRLAVTKGTIATRLFRLRKKIARQTDEEL